MMDLYEIKVTCENDLWEAEHDLLLGSGQTRKEALEDFRDKLEIMMIKCNEMLQQGEE